MNLTANVICIWILKSYSIPKIYIKYSDFVPRYYGKQFIVYHTLFKRLMCPVKKTANINVKNSLEFKSSGALHIKQNAKIKLSTSQEDDNWSSKFSSA